MIRGGRLLGDSVEDISSSCWLKASHLFFSFLVLMVASLCLLVASHVDESFVKFRDLATAFLGLSVLSAVASGLCYLFIELRVQDRSVPCRRFHNWLCCAKAEHEDRVALDDLIRYKKGASTQCRNPATTGDVLCPRNVM